MERIDHRVEDACLKNRQAAKFYKGVRCEYETRNKFYNIHCVFRGCRHPGGEDAELAYDNDVVRYRLSIPVG